MTTKLKNRLGAAGLFLFAGTLILFPVALSLAALGYETQALQAIRAFAWTILALAYFGVSFLAVAMCMAAAKLWRKSH